MYTKAETGMSRTWNWLAELESVDQDVAWKLVQPLFAQTSSLVSGAAVFSILGVVGCVAGGSSLYLAGVAYTLLVVVWRLAQARRFQRARDSATPRLWARRALRSACAAGLGWGLWTPAILLDPHLRFGMMIAGAHAALTLGGAARNASVRTVATSQVTIASIPYFFVCILSGDVYLMLYAPLVLLNAVIAHALITFFNGQTRTILFQQAEKTRLVGQLEAANQDLALMNRQLEALATTDALTGVANRRSFDLVAVREWQRLKREQLPLAMIMMDVDHFKMFNDRYGHPAGDACLRGVALAAESVLKRPADLLARYGGEEFAIILPATETPGALHIAESVRAAIEAEAVPHDASPYGRVTVSVGVAVIYPAEATTLAQLISCADTALYLAKRGGRNAVHVIEPVESGLTAALGLTGANALATPAGAADT